MASVRDFDIDSESLGEKRRVTVFRPPRSGDDQLPILYCADGQAVWGLALPLQQAIEEKGVPPVILVGAHSIASRRAKEYLHGVDDGRFEAHERFFAHELYDWAAAFNPSRQRRCCGVFGFSNGGAFALSMGARHREKYGVVIAFSIAGGPNRVPASEYAKRPIPRYYLSAGTREKPFHRTTQSLAKILREHGVEHHRTERCAGHDFELWQSELPEAVQWSFAAQSAD